MTRNRTHRDEELGAALRALDVPEHRPAFFDELALRLREAPSLDAAPPRPRPRKRLWIGVAAAASAVALAALALGIPRVVAGPETASAVEVQARVRTSLSALRNLSGVFVFECSERGCPGNPGTRRWGFTLTAEGDLRLAGPGPSEVTTYDASAAIVRSAQRSASAGGDTLFYAERRGVAPGPPDLGPPTWVLPEEFGAFVRAALAAADPRVRETQYRDRPAWQLDVDVVPNALVPDFTGDRFEITVDRETGFPVRVVERKGGSQLREMRVEDLVANAGLPGDEFTLAFPTRAEVAGSDDGFRRLPLSGVERAAGYAPLVPSWVPDGYELAEVAVAHEGGPTGVEAGNPASRDVVSLSYRRGLDQVVVTTRRAGSRPALWGDPLATGEGYVDRSEHLTLSEGALRGVSAELVVVPRGIPHLWALADGLVVTVAGDLGRSELVRVAESAHR